MQLLDGIGAGLLGILTPLAVERMLSGTGHFNLGLAAVMTVQGIGATSSNIVAGYLVDGYGYGPTYLVHGLVSVASVACLLAAGRLTRDADPPLSARRVGSKR